MSLHWTGRGEYLIDPAWRQTERPDDERDEPFECPVCHGSDQDDDGACSTCDWHPMDEMTTRGWPYGA